MNVSSGCDDLLHLLEKANLTTYVSPLLEQGADDIEQLKELDNEEFEQLCAMIGMDKKPFHVMRLKKALNRNSSKPHPSDPKITPVQKKKTAVATPVNTPHISNKGLTTNSPFQLESSADEEPVPGHSGKLSTGSSSDSNRKALPPSKAAFEASEQPLPSSNTVSPKTSSSSSSGTKSKGQNAKTLFLPPYLQEYSESRNFDELMDDQTPVQKTLGPCPFLPRMWDLERRELIRKYSSIYGKNFNKRQKELLTPFEEQVNEGAYQLCLRDPTLLVRREELFVLAKRAIKEGGYTYYHGYSKGKDMESTIATTGQKRARPGDSSLFHIPSPKMLITGDLDDDMPKKLSGRMRQERMKDLETLIQANKAQQAAKLVDLEQAQQLCNFSAAFSIQLEVESLGNVCQQLQTNYTALKRKQRRSERYYSLKSREEMSESKTSPRQDMSSPTSESMDAARGGGDFENGEGNPIYSRQGSSYTKKDYFIGDSGGSGGSGGKKKSNSRPGVTAMVLPRGQGSSSSPNPTMLTGDGDAGGDGGGTAASDLSHDNNENDSEVQDLVENVSHATDEVNSLMIREFQKQLVWDI